MARSIEEIDSCQKTRSKAMSIFGAAFDVSKDRWIAFNEDTLTSLSDHETEAEALEACRVYLEREIRRMNILHYLSVRHGTPSCESR
jgi:hypothetical protein